MIKRALVVLLAGITVLAAGCSPAENDNEESNGTSAVLEAKDPKTLTLQLGDLPDGSSEGDLVEGTPEILSSLHASNKIDDGQHAQLAEAEFKGFASRSFTYGGDGSIVSTVIVFESEKAAVAYYDLGFPEPQQESVTVKKISDAPTFGQASFSELVESPGETAPGQEVVSGQTIRTRSRIQNAVIEVLVTEDVGELDEDEAFRITKTAAAKIR